MAKTIKKKTNKKIKVVTKKQKEKKPAPGRRTPVGKLSFFCYLREDSIKYIKEMAVDNDVSASIYLDAVIETAMTKRPLRIGNVIRARDYTEIESKVDRTKKPYMTKKAPRPRVTGHNIKI